MFKQYLEKYYINEFGVLKNILNGKEYKGTKSKNGYLRVDISINGKRKVVFLHRLVAETFIPNLENKPQVNHINGIKTDNRVENLEWVNAKENTQHAVKIGLINTISQGGKKCVQKDLEGNIIKIFNSISEAARFINGKDSSINRVCRGKSKMAYGYFWEYL